MSDITVLGMGAMGTAMVSAFIEGGLSVTAWNRTSDKLAAVEALGAQCIAQCADAIRQSSVTIVCVSDYEALHDIFSRPGVTPLLDGRVIVNFSTGTPNEARSAEDTIHSLGGYYLDGAILVYPANLGAPDAKILVSGSARVFASVESQLRHMGGDLRYLGQNVAAAAALDLAFLSRLMAIVFGTAHGASICESEGVSVGDFADLLPNGDRGQIIARAIHDDNFSVGPSGAASEVSQGALARLCEQAACAGINSEIPRVLRNLVDRAVALGHGKEETASVIKILRALEPRS